MLAALLLAPALMTASLHEVSITGFAFVPDTVRVQPGDTVRWTQNDNATHTSSGTGTGAGRWTSGSLTVGKTYLRVFPTVGRYPYICDFHSMFGTVVVGTPASLRPILVPDAGLSSSGPARDARGRILDPESRGSKGDRTSPAFEKRAPETRASETR